MARKAKYDNLREACIDEAMTIIEASGVEKLSMREVARRLGVSHQAPYKHFESRDHILAEILTRSFEDFARHLDARPRFDNPYADLAAMGQAYLNYAAQNPLHYRLMFGTPLPDPDQHPEMMQTAQGAFLRLRDAISVMALASDPDLNALFVWSTMHGLASILHMEMFDDLSVARHDLGETIAHVLTRIGSGLGAASNLL
jgi:AcrR family transcriptional regulator